MPRSFVSGSSQYLTNATGLVTAAPLTIHAWVRPQFASGLGTVFCLGTQSVNAFYVFLSTTTVSANTSASTGANATVTIPGPVRGRWMPVGAVYASAASRVAYCDGRPGAADVNSRTPTGINETLIGCRRIAVGRDLFWTGQLGEVALWNAALTDGEMLALAKNADPTTIRPASLVEYVPLYGSTANETGRKNTVFTNVGSTTAAARIPVSPTALSYLPTSPVGGLTSPSRRRWIGVAGLAASTLPLTLAA